MALLTAALSLIRTTCSDINSTKALQQRRRDKGRAVGFDPKEPKRITLFVAANYLPWQEQSAKFVQDTWNAESKQFDEKQLKVKIAELGGQSKVRPFVQSLRKKLFAGEELESVVKKKLEFDEWGISLEMVPHVKKVTGFEDVRVVRVDDPEVEDLKQLSKFIDLAVPGQPSFSIENLRI